MRVPIVSLCTFVAWLLAHAAAAAQAPEPLGPTVAAALERCDELTIFDYVTARVEDATVLLSGKVTTPAKKADLERRMATLAGVREVRSEIAVLPGGAADDELRYQVSRAIYGHPAFWSYAAMRKPPIHIVVEDGSVRLEGTVRNQVERAMAASLASGRGGRIVVNALEARPGSLHPGDPAASPTRSRLPASGSRP